MRTLPTALLLTCLLVPAAPAQAPNPAALPFRDPAAPLPQRVDDLVGRLTLEEKVSQLLDVSPAISRLDIPAYNWWNEGLHGIARSGYATLFPQAIGNAATWDVPLLHRIATAISTEARAKYNDAIRHGNHDRYFGLTIWSPNINIFRDPRWGRGQETYGEDPFLTARLGVAFVQGIQGDDPHFLRAIATPKHFAVHSGPETTRHAVDIDPSDHDLWDTYLPAFRATVTDAKAGSIMCAYNAVDQVPACASKLLLDQILRKAWRFQGFVTSDCDAIDDFSQKNGHHFSADHESGSAAGIRAGTDLDCGKAYSALTASVNKHLLSEAELDVSVKRLFTARLRLGLFDPPANVPFSSIPFSVVNSPAHEALALQAARESMVLLKNDNHFLPLQLGSGPHRVQTIAVIGPLAASRLALEGNYNAIPRKPVLPLDGIAAEFGGAHVLYAQGSPYTLGGAVPVPRTILRTAADPQVPGLTAEYFAGPGFEGVPALTRVDKEIDFDWAFANPLPSLWAETAANRFAVRWTGTIAALAAGPQSFQIHLPSCYPCDGKLRFAIFLDGQPLTPIAPPQVTPLPRGFNAAPRYIISFADTNPHLLRIEYCQSDAIPGGGISFEWTPNPALLKQQALATAAKGDVLVAFVGLTSQLEGEEMNFTAKGFASGDRTDLALPDVQEDLIESLSKTGKPLVVVLLNGSAVAVNFAQQNARAILEAWYPGQSGGQAIAETLSGKNNPAGRLPVTFYTGVDQLPPFADYAMKSRTYRYFQGAPLYRFGDGLSYTSFSYTHLKLSTSILRAGDTLTAEVDITNSGNLAGDEVAQLYLIPPKTTVSPNLALAGFQRLHLNPGETRHVSFFVDPRTLSQIDAKGLRAVTPGAYRLSLGGSQPQGDAARNVLYQTFTVTGTLPIPR